MRILVVHNRYRSGQPSGENAVVDQETALLTGAGHHVEHFERHSDDIADMSIVDKALVPLRVPWNPATRRALAERLRAARPDVVHVHNTFPLLSPAVLAACADVGVPVVATLHNYGLTCAPGTLYRDGRICTDCVGAQPIPAIRHGCYRGSAAATLPVAVGMVANRRRWATSVARFFCISGAQRDVLVRAGLPADKLTVKHNVVPDTGRRRTGPGEHVLFLGRLTEEKGLRTLMAAWDAVDLPVPLVIAGAGPLADKVIAWAAGRDDVRYLGLRDRAQCQELTARAVAVVAPSTWLETFGLVVVEAMAAGVPAVASAHGAFVELVDDNESGILHRPGDPAALAAALRAVVEPTHNARLGAAARRRYEQGFTPDAGLTRLLDGYRAASTSAVWA